MAFGEGACLVKCHNGGGFQLLQSVALAKQHTQLRSAACADHDGGGGGQAHGARTGDDEYRNGHHKRGAELSRQGKPQSKGQHRNGHDDRHKDRGDFVDGSLNRQLGVLCRLHHADDTSQNRVLPRVGGF